MDARDKQDAKPFSYILSILYIDVNKGVLC